MFYYYCKQVEAECLEQHCPYHIEPKLCVDREIRKPETDPGDLSNEAPGSTLGRNHMNKAAFAQLISENIEWLLKQPRTLEREHILSVLKNATKVYCG